MPAFPISMRFTARPLHIDTAKASMDRPMAKINNSNALIGFYTSFPAKTLTACNYIAIIIK